jgi:hypothetical protein
MVRKSPKRDGKSVDGLVVDSPVASRQAAKLLILKMIETTRY